MHNITFAFSDFRNDRRGTVAVIFAMSCVVLMLIAGMAVDTARYHDLSARMQQALDGASLAAAKLLSDPNVGDAEIRERALAYFNAATPTFGVKPSSITTPNIIIDRANASVEVAGQLKVPAFFGGIADLPALTVINQKSKVVFDMTKVELAMVLDVTGSMGKSNKLEDLKIASKDVIDTLFDGALNDDSVRIGIAPYSASVNAGALASAVSAVATTTTCTNTWYGTRCTDTTGVDADTCVIERQGAEAFTDINPQPVVPSTMLSNMSTPPWNWYVCPRANVVPLMNRTQRDNLKTNIDSFIADGGTAGHIGTAWGWYLLSPTWSSIFPTESAPSSYADTRVKKAMIIMTDGEFNTSYIGGPPSLPTSDPKYYESAASDRDTQIAESYQQFDTLCASIKDKGITVYTVGFDLHDDAALAHLSSCASNANSFYDAKTGAQLKDAFKSIAERLGNLRVAS